MLLLGLQTTPENTDIQGDRNKKKMKRKEPCRSTGILPTILKTTTLTNHHTAKQTGTD